MEGSGLVHSDNSSIEVSISSVQFSAISDVLVSVSSLVGDFGSGQTVGLIEIGHSSSEFSGFEEDFSWVVKDPLVSDWVRGPWVWDLDAVRSISSVSSFSSISGWVSVTSGPLEVDVISDSGIQVLWDEVVFSGWVGLDNVSSLSSNVQVEDSCQWWDSVGSLGNSEGVGSVFEGSSELSGILSKGNFVTSNSFVDDGIFLNNSHISVVVVVDESSGWVGHGIKSVFSGGDVVSDSENASTSSFGISAVFSGWDGPVVVVGKSRVLLSISEVIFS